MLLNTQVTFWRLIAAVLISCATASPGWATEVSGLTVEWNFDTVQGDVAHDSSGNGHDAKLYGATRVRQADGFSLRMDGFNDYVVGGQSASLGFGGPVSIESWIKPTREGHGEATLFGENYSTYSMTYYSGESCYWYIGGGGNNVRGNLTLNEWNHVTATFDGTQMSLWINGRLVHSRESKHKTYAPTGHFRIGTKDRPDLPQFKGFLDRIRIYRRALSGKEILAHFRSEATEYGFDPNWFDQIRVTPFNYLDRGEMLIEADYRRMQPLDRKSRIEVRLFKQQQRDQIIQRQLIEELPAVGILEIKLPCSDLDAGEYVIQVNLSDEKGARSVEEVVFSFPDKSHPVVSPAQKTVAALDPPPAPAPFGIRVGKGGGFDISIKGKTYPVQSRISWPHGDFNRLVPGDELYGRGESSWSVHVGNEGKDRFRVQAKGDSYTIQRQIDVLSTHVYVRDRYTNTTDQDLGLLIYNEIPIQPEHITKSLLSGYDRFGRQADITDKGPTVFFTDKNTGMGIIPIDDVYVVQAISYVGRDDAAGVATERFALAPGDSYTLEWAIYPTGSGDYYDFINAFRKAEGRISTIDGGLSFISFNPDLRRQVPTKNFIQNLGSKYGIIHCLSMCADDRELSIEGIEFMDFPKEMALLKRQAAAIHKKHPNFKAVFHVAHSLYATNDPDRFSDSQVIGPNGQQARWHPGDYFSQRRRDAGWSWWIFYPTPGNSFHDAMMKSVDVMMDDLGFDGAFMDGFFVGYQGRWTYDGRWDGHSAEIDLNTKTIRRKIGSVLLLSQPSMIEFARKVRDKGGVLIANNSVITRSIANEKYIIHDSESGAGPTLHLAPNMTGLGGGQTEKEVYLNTLKNLSWGQLFVPYHVPRAIGHNLTHPLMTTRQFPMTFEEIRSGMVRGKERIVTMNSGVYGWPGDHSLHVVYKFDARGMPVSHTFLTTVDRDEVRTGLNFSKFESAVIEPIPVTLESKFPVNVRVVRYDDVESSFLINGQGEASLDLFVGASYFPSGDSYRVTVDDMTTEIVEEDGMLSVPLKLGGPVEVLIEKSEDVSHVSF